MRLQRDQIFFSASDFFLGFLCNCVRFTTVKIASLLHLFVNTVNVEHSFIPCVFKLSGCQICFTTVSGTTPVSCDCLICPDPTIKYIKPWSSWCLLSQVYIIFVPTLNNFFVYLLHKFPVIVTRSNNVYGPHQYPEKVRKSHGSPPPPPPPPPPSPLTVPLQQLPLSEDCSLPDEQLILLQTIYHIKPISNLV